MLAAGADIADDAGAAEGGASGCLAAVEGDAGATARGVSTGRAGAAVFPGALDGALAGRNAVLSSGVEAGLR